MQHEYYLNPTGETPNFLPVGTGGLFKGEDPNVSIAELQNNWVEGTPVVYIGKATSIKKRLSQYSAFCLQGKYRFFLPQKRIICTKFRKMMQKTTGMRQFA